MTRASACVFIAIACVACGDKSKTDASAKGVTRACVLADEKGVTTQCFEDTDTLSKAAHESNCQDFEAATKTLVDGPCPKEGRTGTCESADGHKVGCYRDPAGCEKHCTAPAKFKKE